MDRSSTWVKPRFSITTDRDVRMIYNDNNGAQGLVARWTLTFLHALTYVMLFGLASVDAQLLSSDSPAGYIDNAIVRNRFRLRFDAAYDNPFPDRAEFFYAKCGCFSGGNGPGPAFPDSGVDFQELEFAAEHLVYGDMVSAFVELPIRFINPDFNENAAGLGDIRAGFKAALLSDDNSILTFQLRGYFPTGDGIKGLGTEHVSLEPGFLFASQANRLSTFGEFRAWIPIGGEKETFNGTVRNFSGTVLRYGLGAGYDIYQEYCCSEQAVTNRLTAVTEVVGWTVLDGLKFRDPTPTNPVSLGDAVFDSAVNDTIVNLKLGLRWSTPRDSIYVGYGRALTGDIWYRDIVRAEYVLRY